MKTYSTIIAVLMIFNWSISQLPTPCVHNVNGLLLNANTEKPLPQAYFVIWKGDTRIYSDTSDEMGRFNVALPCNTTYHIEVCIFGYKSQNQTFSVSNRDKKIVFELVQNRSDVCTYSALDTFYFTNSTALTNTSKTDVISLSQLMIDFPSIHICLQGHTDSRGSSERNLMLSRKRVAFIKNKLVKHKIESSRIFTEAYGETRLANKCNDTTKCTLSEHSKNRRVQVLIVKN